MSVNELERKIAKMQEWEALVEEAKAEAEALRDEIKAEMLERDTEELEAGKYIVRWTSVLSNRFDTTAFKKQYLVYCRFNGTRLGSLHIVSSFLLSLLGSSLSLPLSVFIIANHYLKPVVIMAHMQKTIVQN